MLKEKVGSLIKMIIMTNTRQRQFSVFILFLKVHKTSERARVSSQMFKTIKSGNRIFVVLITTPMQIFDAYHLYKAHVGKGVAHINTHIARDNYNQSL